MAEKIKEKDSQNTNQKITGDNPPSSPLNRKEKGLIGLVIGLSIGIFIFIVLIGYGFIRQTTDPDWRFFSHASKKEAIVSAETRQQQETETIATASNQVTFSHQGKEISLPIIEGWKVSFLSFRDNKIIISERKRPLMRLRIYSQTGKLLKIISLKAPQKESP